MAVSALVARVLEFVLRKAARTAGDDTPDKVILTHPQEWAGFRTEVLLAAATEAGLDPARLRLVAEPVAAAAHFAAAAPPPEGGKVAVFDFGAGTCDVAVLAADGKQFTVLASAGLDQLGGDLIDQLLFDAVVDRLRSRGLDKLAADVTTDLRSLLTLRDHVRDAKHALSEYEHADIPVQSREDEAVVAITATEFDALVADEIDKAVRLTQNTLEQAGVRPSDLHALYLTGGSSSLRLVHARMAELLDGRPATLGDPKLVVSLGAHVAGTKKRAKTSAGETTVVTMPTAGDRGVGTILAVWLKHVGESVNEGEPLMRRFIDDDLVDFRLRCPVCW
ncbi:Hsp70 family protein [Actinokineospora sp. HUAS TT18]|uniref:Hsp70 family protein n=1 Tax=Actinokineospora sp. HUAS TT18 TaxID=3447451 RepID=UPI003F51F015